MRELFEITGECGSPGSGEGFPLELEIMFQVASEWHICTDHMEVFGLNIKPGSEQDKLQIFGDDQELVKEWDEGQGTPNVAQEGWIYLGSYSEYDYMFVT
eukprot:UN33359